MRRAAAVAFALLALSGGAFSGVARADEAPISDEARRHFKAGVAFMQDPDGEKVEEAHREFKAAYAISRSPKILGNLGTCAMKLERDGEAIEAYVTYLREVTDIDPEERAQITRDLGTLTVSVVRVSIAVDVPAGPPVRSGAGEPAPPVYLIDARVPVRGGRVTNTYGPVADGKIELGLRPGHHVLTARAAGREDQVWEFEAQPGPALSHAFRLAPPAPPPAPEPPRKGPDATPAPEPARPHGASSGPLPWILVGLGGAMVAAGTLTGVLALNKTSDIEARCPSNVCPVGYDLDADRSAARGLVRATDVLLIGGGLLAAAGITWTLLAPSRGPGAAAACTGAGCVGTLRLRF